MYGGKSWSGITVDSRLLQSSALRFGSVAVRCAKKSSMSHFVPPSKSMRISNCDLIRSVLKPGLGPVIICNP